jgi:hypothetical protein
MKENKEKIVWVSANKFIEDQTKEIEKKFKCSNPKPRNKAMGFWGRDEKKKK